ncbi:TIGR02444 family protein [Salinivibrio sp. ES.052]|uniref:TIGR02444 family protein n=1 Tax=Salinivibrio sp. ES.052 TaxID=1882823 RepID=UPI0009266112|nr:TIGR02444 family protein [Salinivibrio sp. ES.052]SIO17666.1 TIGR02444 family protein [Salinivibrio sp. ES.052]
MDGATRRVGNPGGGIQSTLTPGMANAADLWQFCLHHYDKQEVKQACLKLQDEHQGNVNLALLLAWIESYGYGLAPESLTQLKHALSRSEHLLIAYRHLRRDLKPRVGSGQYKKMLNFELSLEKFQQQDLVDALNRQTWLTQAASPLAYYCRQLSPSARNLYTSLQVTPPAESDGSDHDDTV